MSAGDIIDRAVRLYGRNFLAMLRIVIWPSLIAYAGSIFWSAGWRNATLSKGDGRIAITVLLVLSGLLLWAIGNVAFFAALGGASRSLAAHFFDGKPILARDVYRAVRGRLWPLVGATLTIELMVMGALMIAYFFLAIIGMVFVFMMAAMSQRISEWLAGVFIAVFTFAVIAAIIVAFLLIFVRIVYVPQILMVEGKGIFNSIGRSFSLAGGQLRRAAALILFWMYGAWSVSLLLFLPLGYFSDWINPFGAEQPAWYDIAWQTLWQVSEILFMPILMVGCTLLYLDSRVRKEGFDVELLVNRTLAPPSAQFPLYPSAPQWTPPEERGQLAHSILGLDGYAPAPAQVPQSGSEATRKRCARCGAEVSAESRFCDVCGAAFGYWRGAEIAGAPSSGWPYGAKGVGDPNPDQRR